MVSLVVSVVIVVGTWGLLRDSVKLSLNAVPPGIDEREIEGHLGRLPGVVEVHDLHVWGLSTTDTALTAHLVLADGVDGEALLRRLPGEMQERFGIGHVTVQRRCVPPRVGDGVSCDMFLDRAPGHAGRGARDLGGAPDETLARLSARTRLPNTCKDRLSTPARHGDDHGHPAWPRKPLRKRQFPQLS